MRIGLNGSSLIASGAPVADIGDHAAQAEADGFSSYWLAQLALPDALTAIAATASRTSTIELGTAVVPTWLRHPLMLAAQAITVQEVVGGRLALGLGLAHKPMIEAMLRIPFATPAKHMDEYLSVLLPALHDRKVSFEGDIWSGVIDAIGSPGRVPAPPVLLAAMGPRMLQLAGGRTDGTILWLAGPKAIANDLKPVLDDAAAAAGRPEPRIVASVPVCVTAQTEQVRSTIAAFLAGYNDLPSYRGVMDSSGAGGPADVSIVGGAEEVREGIAAFAEAGATDFTPVEFAFDPDDAAATRALLKELAAAG